MGLHLAKHLHGLHGGKFLDEFHKGMAGGRIFPVNASQSGQYEGQGRGGDAMMDLMRQKGEDFTTYHTRIGALNPAIFPLHNETLAEYQKRWKEEGFTPGRFDRGSIMKMYSDLTEHATEETNKWVKDETARQDNWQMNVEEWQNYARKEAAVEREWVGYCKAIMDAGKAGGDIGRAMVDFFLNPNGNRESVQPLIKMIDDFWIAALVPEIGEIFAAVAEFTTIALSGEPIVYIMSHFVFRIDKGLHPGRCFFLLLTEMADFILLDPIGSRLGLMGLGKAIEGAQEYFKFGSSHHVITIPTRIVKLSRDLLPDVIHLNGIGAILDLVNTLGGSGMFNEAIHEAFLWVIWEIARVLHVPMFPGFSEQLMRPQSSAHFDKLSSQNAYTSAGMKMPAPTPGSYDPAAQKRQAMDAAKRAAEAEGDTWDEAAQKRWEEKWDKAHPTGGRKKGGRRPASQRPSARLAKDMYDLAKDTAKKIKHEIVDPKSDLRDRLLPAAAEVAPYVYEVAPFLPPPLDGVVAGVATAAVTAQEINKIAKHYGYGRKKGAGPKKILPGMTRKPPADVKERVDALAKLRQSPEEDQKEVEEAMSGLKQLKETPVASTTVRRLGSGKKRRAPAKEGDGRKKRAEIVKKVMKEKGMKMIEASKYVKQHGLY